jgi:hypothetical protein
MLLHVLLILLEERVGLVFQLFYDELVPKGKAGVIIEVIEAIGWVWTY